MSLSFYIEKMRKRVSDDRFKDQLMLLVGRIYENGEFVKDWLSRGAPSVIFLGDTSFGELSCCEVSICDLKQERTLVSQNDIDEATCLAFFILGKELGQNKVLLWAVFHLNLCWYIPWATDLERESWGDKPWSDHPDRSERIVFSALSLDGRATEVLIDFDRSTSALGIPQVQPLIYFNEKENVLVGDPLLQKFWAGYFHAF